MAFRSIATLSLSFGLVSIPVKVYSATESSAAIRFRLLSRGGQRVRRQYVADAAAPALAEGGRRHSCGGPGRDGRRRPPSEAAIASRGATRSSQRRGRPGRRGSDSLVEARGEPCAGRSGQGLRIREGPLRHLYRAELEALAGASRPTIDIVSFIPEASVDATFYDKAYYLAPDKAGSKPYALLHAAMRASGRSALARWAWRGKEYVVQIRPLHDGMVLQQLLYADEVRALDDLGIELAPVGKAELDLALRLIAQIGEEAYDPHRFVDEEKQRILAAVERKVAGRKLIARPAAHLPSAQVIDLVAALRASLDAGAAASGPARREAAEPVARERKPVRRAAKPAAKVAPAVASAARPRGRQSGR